jgi:hypothetical protein
MTLSALPVTVPARAGCGCGAAGAVDLSTATFIRPRFFAGQLLTEDDLGSLTAYVTAKDRLHNRYLFGAGVVCGLEVSCDPCGGGTVSVEPGYALDCCGNDLVLACATTLDVNAMIRDLRIAQLGKDCGDPCADPGGQQQGTATRRYCLYARYGEQTTDPVAAYATEEPCGQTTCEPTRIREGISFALKCPNQDPPPDDLWRRLQACCSETILNQVGRLKAYGDAMVAAVQAAEHPPAFTTTDTDRLNKLLAEGDQQGADRIRSTTEYVRELVAVLARYNLAKDRPPLDDLDSARVVLDTDVKALQETVTATWADPLDRVAVGALLAQAAQLAKPAGTQPEAVQLAMLAQGRPLDEAVLGILSSDAAAVMEWLLARLDTNPVRTDCELGSLVAAVPVNSVTTRDPSSVRSLGQANGKLVELLIRYVVDCVCAALNPPCAPCEDTGVLLACLEVRDCKVIRICNSERDYVISGSALRYWLPVQRLEEYIEDFCCPTKSRSGRSDAATAELAFQEVGFGVDPAAGGTWELLDLPQPANMLNSVLQQVGIALPAPAVPAPRAPRPATPDVDTPAVDAMAAHAIAEQLTALTQRVTELTDQLTRTQTQLTELANRPSPPAGRVTRNRRTATTRPRAAADPTPANQPPAVEPSAEPVVEQPAAGQPAAEQPAADQPVADQAPADSAPASAEPDTTEAGNGT